MLKTNIRYKKPPNLFFLRPRFIFYRKTYITSDTPFERPPELECLNKPQKVLQSI